jgi:hypothetical protein
MYFYHPFAVGWVLVSFNPYGQHQPRNLGNNHKGGQFMSTVSQIEERWIKELKIFDLETFLESSADYILVAHSILNHSGHYDRSGVVIKTDKYNAYKLGTTVYYDKFRPLHARRTDVDVVHLKDASPKNKNIKPPKNKPNSNVAGKKRLPKPLWMAVNFAASMMRKGQPRTQAVKIASNYYKVNYYDVMSGLAQRGGRARRKK